MNETQSEEYQVEVIRNTKTNKVVREFWRRSGCLEREQAPSIIGYDENTGAVTEELWCKNGVTHRVGAPAHICTDPASGIVTKEVWAVGGKIHREGNKPAMILRDPKSGNITHQEYYMFDKQIPKQNTGPTGPS